MNQYNLDANAYAIMSSIPGYLYVKQLQPITKEEENMTVVSKIRELSKDSDSKLLAKYGIISDCGELTSEAKQVLWDMLFEEKKEAIVAKLKELEAAEKKAAKQ